MVDMLSPQDSVEDRGNVVVLSDDVLLNVRARDHSRVSRCRIFSLVFLARAGLTAALCTTTGANGTGSDRSEILKMT